MVLQRAVDLEQDTLRSYLAVSRKTLFFHFSTLSIYQTSERKLAKGKIQSFLNGWIDLCRYFSIFVLLVTRQEFVLYNCVSLKAVLESR